MIPVKSKTAITNNPLHFSFPIKDIENMNYAVMWKRSYQNKSTVQFTHLAMQTLQGQQQWRGDRGPPCFQRVPIRYIPYDKCVFVWCKKNLQTLINMTVRMVCARASKKERKLGTYSIWSPTYCQKTRLYTCPCFSWPSSSPLSIGHHFEQALSYPSPSDAHWHLGPCHSHLKHKTHSS